MAASSDTNPPPTTATNTEAAANTVSPPWTQIVPTTSSSANVVVGAGESPVEGGEGNVAAASSKKPAWNKKPMTMSKPPSTDVGQGESGGGAALIGADFWPSLMECTNKSSSKTFSSPNVGSPLSLEVTEIDSSSTATVASSVRSPTLPTQKPTTSYPKHHLTSNHGQLARQKSAKREGEGNSQSNGGFSHQPPQSAGDGSHYHYSQGSPKPNSGGNLEKSGIDNVQAHSHKESGQKNASGENPHHRNSFRKGNGGPQSRGDGSHQNYGGRRSNQERGNHDWNHQKSFNGRDASLQPAVVSRGFVRPPPVATPFIHPPTMQPLINPMMGPDLPFFYIPPGLQLVAPMPQMYFPAPDLELYTDIMKQIDYYFSNENLVRDTFLRQKMDENGWVSVGVISEFNKVKSLTNDTFQILEAVRHSMVVEVQGDKIRRRGDWMRWVMPPFVQFPMSDAQSPKGSPVSPLTDRIQSISVDEKTNDPSIIKAAVGGSSSAPQTGVDKASPGGC
ncbi:la-related protein 1C-like [Silene latifolia]|uniref:la-related protein 1C-like n=1 Tax=Silene latifolia TaxID=37657 RepID=UPI003D782B21